MCGPRYGTRHSHSNTLLSDFSQSYGSHPCDEVGNRIGGQNKSPWNPTHKISSAWLFGCAVFALAATTFQTHRTPISLSRTGFDPCGEVGNRIGGHKKRSFLYGTVRPRVNSECGIIYNPRPLAFEACLKRLALTQQVSMPWNRHHGTESHQNQNDQKLSEHFTWH